MSRKSTPQVQVCGWCLLDQCSWV